VPVFFHTVFNSATDTGGRVEKNDAGLGDVNAPDGVGGAPCAIQGHEFGLRLAPMKQEQLIAFLRTL
jgi:hypothetical protein